MQLIYEILPVFLFFLAFKFYGIYVATVVGMVTTFLQVMITRLFKGKWVKQELITLVVFVVFGGMTLYFHNPIFVKWKPTIVFGIFSIIILGSSFTAKPIVQRMMENILDDKAAVAPVVWRNLNIIWGIFFLSLAIINLYIAYYLSNEAWVNFKFYGITGALLVLSLSQALYLVKHAEAHKS